MVPLILVMASWLIHLEQNKVPSLLNNNWKRNYNNIDYKPRGDWPRLSLLIT